MLKILFAFILTNFCSMITNHENKKSRNSFIITIVLICMVKFIWGDKINEKDIFIHLAHQSITYSTVIRFYWNDFSHFRAIYTKSDAGEYKSKEKSYKFMAITAL